MSTTEITETDQTGTDVQTHIRVGQLPSYLLFTEIDRDAIREHVDGAEEYDAFFVDTKNGEYSEVWGIHGIVPKTHKMAYKLR